MDRRSGVPRLEWADLTEQNIYVHVTQFVQKRESHFNLFDIKDLKQIEMGNHYLPQTSVPDLNSLSRF